MRIHAAAKNDGAIFHGSSPDVRPRRTQSPNAARGRHAWASNSQPTYGMLGLAISGFRPSRQAQTYQAPTAAARSAMPKAKKRLSPAPIAANHVTNAGESQIASRFGKKPRIGLAAPSGRRPRLENTSAAHGASCAKWTNK